MAISIDPNTGLKIFKTRAVESTDIITSHGYDIVTDESLTDLPGTPTRRGL